MYNREIDYKHKIIEMKMLLTQTETSLKFLLPYPLPNSLQCHCKGIYADWSCWFLITPANCDYFYRPKKFYARVTSHIFCNKNIAFQNKVIVIQMPLYQISMSCEFHLSTELDNIKTLSSLFRCNSWH